MKFEVVCETVVEEKAKMFRWFVGIFFEQTSSIRLPEVRTKFDVDFELKIG